ncbi:uroporphyrinogen-III C-methyltransferase [Vibrio sp. 99-8-1]|uniref:uroporphyrinogen-III C-methyltransferase n=1 Tax=Vibrio sp. 99-8-1 TaxID=2607602 RepID=UPI0014937E3E|nr:uroporphyrinogen-III C-methyltransferase [Vibrio sp. 99-8-1]NOI68437.1 heme biosynthesis operon protein HemX [Vibrio sp. 99-8-1]
MTSKNNGQSEPEKKDSQTEVTSSTDNQKAKDDKPKKTESSKASKAAVKEPSSDAKSASNDKLATDANKPSSKAKPQPSTKPIELEEKQGKRGVKLGTFAIFLTLFVGGGAAVLVNQQNTQHQAQIAQLEAQINNMNSQLEQKLASAKATTQSDIKQVDNKTETAIDQQQKSIKSLQVALADVKGRRPNDWLLAESDYLVKLAGRKLMLEKDVESATLLMESADQRISVLNDPSLVPLRKEMAKDITALKSVALIDKDGLALRLMSLQQQVDQLPLANAILPDAPVVEKAVVSEDINDWQENLLTSMKDFSEQFITFRTRDGNVIPLLSPKQHYYLKENIKGKIETAVRAVYQENQEIYKMSLDVADKWAMQFFKLDDPAVEQFSKSIQQLATQNISVKYPVKLSSQKALSDVINERLRRQVTSMTVEEK